jgi:hypothetical protein
MEKQIPAAAIRRADRTRLCALAPRDARQLASQRMIVGIWGNPVFALRQPRHVGRNPPCLIPDSNFAADRRPQLPLCA